MNFRGYNPPTPPGFQIAPMVDVLLFLLIFFLMTWNFSRNETELDIKVPKAREGKEVNRAMGEIIVNIKPDGRVILNRKDMDSAGLEEALKKLSALYPDQTVVLRADISSNYRSVVQVLDVCRRAGISNIAFATSRQE